VKKKSTKKSIWNLPNKITLLRIILSFIVVIILILPFDMMGINIPKLFVSKMFVIPLRYNIKHKISQINKRTLSMLSSFFGQPVIAVI